VVGLVLGVTMTITLVASTAGAGGSEPAASRTYVVRPGDTVWSIIRSRSDPRADPRPLVDQMIKVNHLDGALIWPGQELELPPGARLEQRP
jgi:LysM repeat protein